MRNQRVHDWRLTLLPAAIEAGVGMPALRICKALCDHQRGRHPVVYMATDQLCEELGMEKRNAKRAVRQLERAGLLRVVLGGGRQGVPRGHEGKANTYILGAALAGDVEALIKGVRGDTLSTQTRVSVVTPYPRAAEITKGVAVDTPPLGSRSDPSGDRGKGTVALTGDSPLIEPSETSTPHRFRDLVRRLYDREQGGKLNA